MYKETFKNKIIDLIELVDKDEDINIKNAADIIYQSMKKVDCYIFLYWTFAHDCRRTVL